MTPPSGLLGTSRSATGCSRRTVADRPNASNSTGTGGRNVATGLVESAMTTNWADAAATILSRVCAAPPPVISQPSGAIWSAPSMVTSSWLIVPKGSTDRPNSRAACSVRGDDATHRIASRRRASAGNRYATDRHVVDHVVRGSLGRGLLLSLDVDATW